MTGSANPESVNLTRTEEYRFFPSNRLRTSSSRLMLITKLNLYFSDLLLQVLNNTGVFRETQTSIGL